MKKVQTTYQGQYGTYHVSEEVKNHLSVTSFGEPCSGVLRHWGTKEELINELNGIIKELESL
jgi:hypothetical protein